MYKNYYGNAFETFLNQYGEIGRVDILSYPLVYAKGLPKVRPKEVVIFESGDIGYVMSLSKEYVEVMVLSGKPINIGAKIALGHSIYEYQPINNAETVFRPLEVYPLGIDYRETITEPLETGVALV